MCKTIIGAGIRMFMIMIMMIIMMMIIIIMIMIMIMMIIIIIIIIIMCIIYNIFRHRSSDPLRINSITTDTVCTEKETLKGGLRR